MPQPLNQPGDLERGNVRDGRLDPQSTPDQSSQGKSNFGDSSGPLFSIYSEAAEEEDNKMAERVQKDTEGFLIFAGLFSASVAALLSVTVQDLRPNSQDTSAFYLGNIYAVLADPNVTRASTPSPVAKPLPFSPPRYAVWVNSLWFLSFVFSLIGALVSMARQQWVRRYIKLTQPARCSPEKRARARAFFSDYVNNLGVTYFVEFPTQLLHGSLILFFCGLGVFLFNTNHTVFGSVIWAIVYFSIWYVETLVIYRVKPRLSLGRDGNVTSERSWKIDLGILRWLIGALGEDHAQEKFFEAIPGFFNSKLVKQLEEDFPEDLLNKFWNTLNGFLCRALSSNLVAESVKTRLDIGMNAMRVINSTSSPCDILVEDWGQVTQIAEMVPGQLLTYCLSDHEHTAHYAQCIVAKILASMPERDGRWIQFATDAFGLPERDIRDYIDHGNDSLSLAILVHLFRQSIRYRFYDLDALMAFSKLDIHNTLSGLQHDFCTVWNEMVQEARNRGSSTTPVRVLKQIRRLYVALHQGTDAAPTAFSASTDTLHGRFSSPIIRYFALLQDADASTLHHDHILWQSSSYPSCDIPSHRPDPTAYLHITNSRAVSISTQPGGLPGASSPYSPSHGRGIVPQRAEEANITVGPPLPSNPTTTTEIGGASNSPMAAPHINQGHSSPRRTDISLSDSVAATLQVISPATPLSHPMESNIKDMAPQTSSTEPKPLIEPASPFTPAPASDTLIFNKSLTSGYAGAASASNPLLPASSVVGFSDPASLPPSHVPSLPSSEFPALHSSAIPSRPTGNATPLRLRARGLVNTGSMCFVNVVLQLLVHSPPFFNLFRELGDLRGQRGAEVPETGGVATPLLDATLRFVDEFKFDEKKLPLPQQPPHQAAKETSRKDEKGKERHNAEDSFEPTYLYDAMKEKGQLKRLLNDQLRDAEQFFRLYLDALDEELRSLPTSIGMHKPASSARTKTAPEVEERVHLSGVAKVEKRGLTVESPIVRIFGGKSRSTVRAPNQLDVVTVENWRSLQLNIQPDSVYSIQDALAHVSPPQPVQVGQFSPGEASQQVLLEALPLVLVVHFERFLKDVAVDSIVKVGKPVQFGPELEIPLEIMAPIPGKLATPVHYRLYGVLCHHGESADRGHYTVDVLHPNGDSGSGESWLHIDDEVVSTVRREDMFGRQGTEKAADEWPGCAYLLLYCCTNPTQI